MFCREQQTETLFHPEPGFMGNVQFSLHGKQSGWWFDVRDTSCLKQRAAAPTQHKVSAHSASRVDVYLCWSLAASPVFSSSSFPVGQTQTKDLPS